MFSAVAAVTLVMSLILIYRENTWRARMEELRADFGRELTKRDHEIIRLNAIVETLVTQGRVNINADELNVGRDIAGRDTIANLTNPNK